MNNQHTRERTGRVGRRDKLFDLIVVRQYCTAQMTISLVVTMCCGCGSEPNSVPSPLRHSRTDDSVIAETVDRQDDPTPGSLSRSHPAEESSGPLTQVIRRQSQGGSMANETSSVWDSEVLSGQIDRQLEVLRSFMSRSASSPQESAALSGVTQMFAPTVAASIDELSPSALRTVFDADGIVVRRPVRTGTDQLTPVAEKTRPLKRSAIASAVQRYRDRVRRGGSLRCEVKLVRINDGPQQVDSTIRVHLAKVDSPQSIQCTSVWHMVWQRPGPIAALPLPDGQTSAPMRIIKWQITEHEEVMVRGGPIFEDVTAAVLGETDPFTSQVLPGIPHWLNRLPRELLDQFGHHGLAVGDVDGDGRDDIYVCDAGGLPNRLYIQQADASAIERAAASGVDLLDNCTSALLVDLDNDGDQDLLVTADPYLHLFENDGRGTFRPRRPVRTSTDSFSLAAADFDADGLLDIYLCGYDRRRGNGEPGELAFPVPYHDANNGAPNRLLRNLGEFKLQDVTEQVGLEANNRRFSLAASWEDFDNDGDQDLYVANDFGRNNLYVNEGGHFRDLAAQASAEDQASGMSVAWGDFGHDGTMDLYVGNMFSMAGNRISNQQRFSEQHDSKTTSLLQRMARGNSLLENHSRPDAARFVDVSIPMNVTMGRWSWASPFVDLNADGWLDIVVANGYLTNPKLNDL